MKLVTQWTRTSFEYVSVHCWGKGEGKMTKSSAGIKPKFTSLVWFLKNILITLTFNNNAFFVAVVVIVIVTSSVRMNSQCLKCETNCLLITRIEISNNIWLQFLTRNQEPSRTFLSLTECIKKLNFCHKKFRIQGFNIQIIKIPLVQDVVLHLLQELQQPVLTLCRWGIGRHPCLSIGKQPDQTENKHLPTVLPGCPNHRLWRTVKVNFKNVIWLCKVNFRTFIPAMSWKLHIQITMSPHVNSINYKKQTKSIETIIVWWFKFHKWYWLSKLEGLDEEEWESECSAHPCNVYKNKWNVKYKLVNRPKMSIDCKQLYFVKTTPVGVARDTDSRTALLTALVEFGQLGWTISKVLLLSNTETKNSI